MYDQEENIYKCELCNNNFELKSIYACQNGHFYCMKCFKKEEEKDAYYYDDDIKCHSQGDLRIESSKKMFPNPDKFSKLKGLPNDKSLQLLYKSSHLSLLSLSRKPIICPHKFCNKAISISAIENHFVHEHKNVNLINTQIEARNGLDLDLNDINYNEKLCLVLINIIETEVGQEYEVPKIPTIKPTFIVIATKLALYNDYLQAEEEEDAVSEFSNPCTPLDKIIIWIASNVPTNYFYTLAISTACNGIRLKYYGPLKTLNEDYEKLCEEGRGLVLTQNHIVGMTDAGQKPLRLDILIHDESKDD